MGDNSIDWYHIIGPIRYHPEVIQPIVARTTIVLLAALATAMSAPMPSIIHATGAILLNRC